MPFGGISGNVTSYGTTGDFFFFLCSGYLTGIIFTSETPELHYISFKLLYALFTLNFPKATFP